MNNKLKNIQEANIRLESRIILEDSTEQIKYTVQQNPQTKRFRIFATNSKFKNPTDAETVFGKNEYFRDYTTQDEAQRAINNINNQAKQQALSNAQTAASKTSTSGDTESDYGKITEQQIQKIKSIMKI